MSIISETFKIEEKTVITNKILEKNEKIKGDFAIIFRFIFSIIKYILLFYPRTLKLLYAAISNDNQLFKKTKKLLITEPIEGMKKVIDWFFEAKVTSSLILLLWGIYLIQVIFFTEPVMQLLMSNPKYLTNGFIWTNLTSIFLHANITHILSNSLALLVFGRFVERYITGITYLLLFLGSGIIANVVSNLILQSLNENVFSLGASGAIAGIIMFAIVIEPFALTYMISGFPLPVFLVGWSLIASDITGITNSSTINHFAHLGGYASILALFFVLDCENQKRTIRGLTINLAMISAIIILWQLLT